MTKYMIQIILAAMALGITVGYPIFTGFDAKGAREIAGYFDLGSTMFLQLIQMIIVPLVFSTLVVGFAPMGDSWVKTQT